MLEDPEFYNREYDAFRLAKGFTRAEYVERSRDALTRVRRIPDIVYDQQSGSKLDLYPAGKGSPLFVWIHGGYWRASTKDENIFIAPALVQSGISVASIDYTLAPAVRIGEIVRQVRQSIVWLRHNARDYEINSTRIHVGGHSAGGHLVGMLLADGWRQEFGLPRSGLFGAALAISGLFDLAPIQKTFVNEQLDLNEQEIVHYSPVRRVPANSEASLLITFGGSESSEFARQSREYLNAWQAGGNRGQFIEMPGYHHFDIIMELENTKSPLFRGLVTEIGAVAQYRQ